MRQAVRCRASGPEPLEACSGAAAAGHAGSFDICVANILQVGSTLHLRCMGTARHWKYTPGCMSLGSAYREDLPGVQPASVYTCRGPFWSCARFWRAM